MILVSQHSIFSEKTAWFKPSSLFLKFLRNDITLFSSLFFSEKTTWFKPSSPFLSFLKNDITLFSSQFSLKRQHGSNQVVYFLIFSKVTLRWSVLNFLWNDRWFEPSSLILDFLKNDITLLSSQFFLKRQHDSNQVVHS